MREKRLKYNGNAIRELKRRIGVKSGAGFTLIELIVVLSVVAILSILGIASFVRYNYTQTVNSAANELATMLNLAKSRAQSQVKPLSCTQSLEGYVVNLCAAGASCYSSLPLPHYELDAKCGGYVPISTGKLPQNVCFGDSSCNYSGTKSFFFPVLSGGVVGNGTVNITGYSITKYVTVDPYGNISIK